MPTHQKPIVLPQLSLYRKIDFPCWMATPTFHTTIGLAWAIPVKADVLGAHLEAYEEYVSVIRTLRLCHKLGNRGEDAPNAFITTLPPELVAMIEGLIVQESRQRCLESWSRDMKCYANTCTTIDHYTDHEIRDRYFGFEDLSYKYSRNRVTVPLGPGLLCELEEDHDFIDAEHDFRRDEWVLRNSTTSRSPAFTYQPCAGLSKILKEDFGLERILPEPDLRTPSESCAVTCYLALHSRVSVCSSSLEEENMSSDAVYTVNPSNCSALSSSELS
ncbi:MAG: hypothetical protein M1812_005196 [Candelaria pacifica]|nr:MAG: hypothetical protein M1812_005196 [Candelaria pacifica]